MDAVVSTLKKTLSLARKFPQYNYREYFIRKTKADIELAKEGKFSGDASAILEQMKRMVSMHTLFQQPETVGQQGLMISMTTKKIIKGGRRKGEKVKINNDKENKS